MPLVVFCINFEGFVVTVFFIMKDVKIHVAISTHMLQKLII